MTSYELTHFKKMVRVWKTKSLLFCLRYDPPIVFRRQNHITLIFINSVLLITRSVLQCSVIEIYVLSFIQQFKQIVSKCSIMPNEYFLVFRGKSRVGNHKCATVEMSAWSNIDQCHSDARASRGKIFAPGNGRRYGDLHSDVLWQGWLWDGVHAWETLLWCGLLQSGALRDYDS